MRVDGGHDASPLLAPAAGHRIESLDARVDLPKEEPCQVACGKVQGEVPSMPDEASARLEEPLLETGEGPVLYGNGQNEPAQQIAEGVGDDRAEGEDIIDTGPVTGTPGQAG